ncbi:MAG: copper resistance protein CopC [Streptosporangiales bacterium]|nr:copper resistance protein CopC [Streptosporangiales bacterium]MBO0890363.1 copper resistance protein CopC [Acidothermales bacterium]
MDRRRAGAVAVLTLVATAVVAAFAAPSAASAHDVLVGTAPKARSTVTTPRSTVTLTFGDPVQTSFAEVVVTDSGGDRLSVGKPDVVDDTVTQRIQPFRTTGAYRVSWRIVSADGHPASGTFAFIVGSGAVSTAAPTGSAPATTPAQRQAGDAQSGSFLQRHGVHVLIGLVIVVVGGGILVWERRRRSG